MDAVQYAKYLRSDHWIEFSSHVRKSRCFCCGVEKTGLHVHHITYERVGKELEQDVVTVCNGCHIKIHKRVKRGTKLEDAHFVVKKSMTSREGHLVGKWCSWPRLLNPSLQQTIGKLKAFLVLKGLLEDGRASKLAYRLKFARVVNGKERWHKMRFIDMARADRKIWRCRQQGKAIYPSLRKRALI